MYGFYYNCRGEYAACAAVCMFRPWMCKLFYRLRTVRVRSAPIACLTDAEGLQPSEASKAVHFRVCPPGFPRRQTWAKGYPLRVFILKNRKNDHPLLIGGLRIHIKNASKALFYRILSVLLSCRGFMTFATINHVCDAVCACVKRR